MKRHFGFWLLLLSASLLSSACASEVIVPDNNAPRDIYGKLEGWGAGGIVNPKGTPVPDPKGRLSIHLQAELDAAAVFTVQFSIGAVEDPAATGNVPVATIKFSVNGVTVTRKISVYNGASISGPGQVCEVNAFDETQDPNNSSPYPVSITVTRGTRGGFTVPTLQNVPAFNVIAGNLSSNIEIPQDAGAVLLEVLLVSVTPGTPLNLSKFNVEFLNGANGVISSYQVPPDFEFIPIPPGAVAFRVDNGDSTTALVSVVFGIDG